MDKRDEDMFMILIEYDSENKLSEEVSQKMVRSIKKWNKTGNSKYSFQNEL